MIGDHAWFVRLAVQHVRETPVKPGVANGVVVPGVDGLGKHMRERTAHSRHFLLESPARMSHQLLVATIPRLGLMCERTRDVTGAGAVETYSILWHPSQSWLMVFPSLVLWLSS